MHFEPKEPKQFYESVVNEVLDKQRREEPIAKKGRVTRGIHVKSGRIANDILFDYQ